MDEAYTLEEQKELLKVARQTIKNHLKGAKKVYPATENHRFKESRGVFVTLHIEGQLRGCIGYPMPVKPLLEAVVDNAISASTEDPRFPPLIEKELAGIDIEISILTVPKEVKDMEDVKVGRDGIIITKGFHRGLLLPQVPVEQNWNLTEYISYGCLKAGLPSDEWKREIKIETFQAFVFGELELKTT